MVFPSREHHKRDQGLSHSSSHLQGHWCDWRHPQSHQQTSNQWAPNPLWLYQALNVQAACGHHGDVAEIVVKWRRALTTTLQTLYCKPPFRTRFNHHPKTRGVMERAMVLWKQRLRYLPLRACTWENVTEANPHRCIDWLLMYCIPSSTAKFSTPNPFPSIP